MKVLYLLESGNLVIKSLPMSELKEGQAIVKIEACGICGSDVTAYRGVGSTIRYPINGLDHEGVSIIQEIGENDKGLKSGDRVALGPYAPCSKYHTCAVGCFNNCANLHVRDVHKNGMMSEYFLYSVRLLYKLPDELTSTHAALVEPLTIGLHGITRARISGGEHRVVFGADIIGLMTALAHISYGVTPILVDVLQKRLDYAKELGVPCTFNSKDGNVEEYLWEVIGGKLPEVMTDCTGVPVILENMHNYVCHRRRIALAGWPYDPVLTNAVRLMQKGIDVCPSRNSNGRSPETIGLVNKGKVSTDAIITKMIELDQVEDTIKDMIQPPSDCLKVIANI